MSKKLFVCLYKAQTACMCASLLVNEKSAVCYFVHDLSGFLFVLGALFALLRITWFPSVLLAFLLSYVILDAVLLFRLVFGKDVEFECNVSRSLAFYLYDKMLVS